MGGSFPHLGPTEKMLLEVLVSGHVVLRTPADRSFEPGRSIQCTVCRENSRSCSVLGKQPNLLLHPNTLLILL